MRWFLQKLLTQLVIRLANRFSARPDQGRVFAALDDLYGQIISHHQNKGLIIPFHPEQDKFVILSDQHKGARNDADDFALAEKNYLAALNYYNRQQYTYINLGDSEELWKNHLAEVRRHNQATFEAERQFLQRGAFIKIFGNHDLYWGNDPLAPLMLRQIYGQELKIYEGVLLQSSTNGQPALAVYLTHGHQGDLQSDGNWFSKWFVAEVWERLQAYLRINPNVPSNNDDLKTAHNTMMYEWSAAQKQLLLITGHTHQPVFASVTHIEKLIIQRDKAREAGDEATAEKLQQQITALHLKGDASMNFKGYKDTYFNSGCCCFDDGDITGIEIAEGTISLIKWKYNAGREPERLLLEESKLTDLKL